MFLVIFLFVVDIEVSLISLWSWTKIVQVFFCYFKFFFKYHSYIIVELYSED